MLDQGNNLREWGKVFSENHPNLISTKKNLIAIQQKLKEKNDAN